MAAAVCVLALTLAGCGAHTGKPPPTPTVSQVRGAMSRQPRMSETLTGGTGTVRRAVVDTKGRYLALYAPSGKVTVLDKSGVEYRLLNTGCYGRYHAGPTSTQAFWTGLLASATGPHYTTTVSGGTVIYRHENSQVVVDARTDLIRSASSSAYPAGGIPAASATLSYPATVPEAPIPTPACR